MLLVAATGVGGCQSPAGMLGSPGSQLLSGGGANKAQNGGQSDQNKSDQNKSGQHKSDQGQSNEPIDVEVRSLEPGTHKAGRILAEKYADFAKRRPLGFDARLPGMVLSDLRRLGRRATRLPERLRKLDSRALFQKLLPALVCLILGVFFGVLDRVCLHRARRLQARIHLDLSGSLTQLARAAVVVVGRVMPVALLVLLSYFPLQPVTDHAPWSLFLTKALGLATAYRAISAVLVLMFSGGFARHVPADHARRLELYGRWLTRIIFGFLLALAAINTFEYRDSFYYFVEFFLRVTVAFAPAYLLRARSSVLALLPATDGSRLYSLFRRTLVRYYNWLILGTVALLLLRAAGYHNAGAFVLGRGYAIMAVVLVAFALHHTVKKFVRRRTELIDAAPQDNRKIADHQPQLGETLEQFLVVGGGLVLVVVILDLLAVREATVALLRTPLISVGNVRVSLFNVLAVGLIIFGTILAVKLIKAVLNAKVYPAFSVDVGVAYALNTLLSYVFFVVGFLMVLGAIGVNLSAIAVVLASLGVGIGFGLQTLTENVISGFIILFGRSVKKGDFVTVNDTYGRVEAVGARSVVIRTPDNYDMLIPSNEMVGGQITNWTFRDSLVRLHVPVGVGYAADPQKVKQVLLETAANAEFGLDDPEAEVWLVGFGDNSVNYELLLHFDCRQVSPKRFKGLLYFDLWEALHDADIELPFPQRDIHVRSAQGLAELGGSSADSDPSAHDGHHEPSRSDDDGPHTEKQASTSDA